jgi:hypothetical protein
VTAGELRGLDRDALLALMQRGHPIDPGELDDRQYRGVSLGLPGLVERLTWKTFIKAFHRDPITGELRGWNVRIDQRRAKSYTPKRKRGRPVTFGHFRVVPATGHNVPRGCDRGLLLDYAYGGGTMGALRDPIVALNPGSADLLLGWSYLAIGGKAVPTPSFFSLERDGEVDYIPRHR